MQAPFIRISTESFTLNPLQGRGYNPAFWWYKWTSNKGQGVGYIRVLKENTACVEMDYYHPNEKHLQLHQAPAEFVAVYHLISRLHSS